MPDYYNKLSPDQKKRMYSVQAALFVGIIVVVGIVILIAALAK